MEVFKYSLLDLVRNRWSLFYSLFFLLSTWGLLYLNADSTRTIASLLTIILFVLPLVCSIFSLMYCYQVMEYIEVILAQPVSRFSIFSGIYISLVGTLSACLVVGVGLPFGLHALSGHAIHGGALAALLLGGVALTAIFVALALLVALRNGNRVKGFAWMLLIWCLMAILYDGFLLIAFVAFENYPLDHFALAGVLFNPVDMSRVLVIYQLDLSAMLGYSGAVFQQFFDKGTGSLLIVGSYLAWLALPAYFFLKTGRTKDF